MDKELAKIKGQTLEIVKEGNGETVELSKI